MARPSRENPEVREFILRNVHAHPNDIRSVVQDRFGLSRQSIIGYLKRLVNSGLLTAQGQTSSRQYILKPTVEIFDKIKLTPGLSEDSIFRFRILPHVKDVPQNIIDICQYGFTEIFNNAIDHSGSEYGKFLFQQTYSDVQITIVDDGVGIFQKIQRDFGYEDHRQALLELSKGKLTSDKRRHSGQGIFFTSRMFDEFSIRSANLLYSRTRREEDEWLFESKILENFTVGTTVRMNISNLADWTTRQILDRHQSDPIGFRRTHVPIALGKYPDEQLISRSQAKRILARFDQFEEVLLDFDGVQEIGPAFADEIFRVFHVDHPFIKITPIRANEGIRKTIDAVFADQEPRLSGI
jgi:anti-sigma regulatory factor (Ser/Thr protein kinase)